MAVIIRFFTFRGTWLSKKASSAFISCQVDLITEQVDLDGVDDFGHPPGAVDSAWSHEAHASLRNSTKRPDSELQELLVVVLGLATVDVMLKAHDQVVS